MYECEKLSSAVILLKSVVCLFEVMALLCDFTSRCKLPNFLTSNSCIACDGACDVDSEPRCCYVQSVAGPTLAHGPLQ